MGPHPFIAPPNVLSAVSYRVEDDDLLRPGIHLRIIAGSSASFPITPFLVCKVSGGRSPLNEGAQVRVVSQAGGPRGGAIHVQQAGWPVRLEFKPADNQIDALSMIDGDLVLATRTRGPWVFGLPDWRWVRMKGSATRLFADALWAPQDPSVHGELATQQVCPPLALPAAPGGSFPWYIGSEAAAEKAARVGQGWPRTWGPREQSVFRRWRLLQDGTFQPLPAPLASASPTAGHEEDEERSRVSFLLDSDPAVTALVDKMLRSDSAPPWEQSVEFNDAHGRTAKLNPLSMLQLSMADYGMARHFGYAKFWRDGELTLNEQNNEMLAVYAIVVLDPARIPEADRGMLSYTLQRVREPQTRDLLEQQILQAIKVARMDPDPEAHLQRIKDFATRWNLVVAPFVAYTSPVEPYDPPAIDGGTPLRRQWSIPVPPKPSDSYSSVFAFERVPMTALALLERKSGTEWSPRSGTDDDDAADAYKDWLKPCVFGREKTPAYRSAELKLEYGPQARAALLGDHKIPAKGEGANGDETRFRAWGSDLFNRFGTPVEFICTPPPRPKLPLPKLNFYLLPDPIAQHEAAASPGKLQIAARFDTGPKSAPLNGNEIAVSGLLGLARGSVPIASLKLRLSGVEELFAGGSSPLPTIEYVVDRASPTLVIPLPPLKPMSKARLVLAGSYIGNPPAALDPNDADPKEAELPFFVTDRRAPPVHKTGMGLLWTSRPSPAPDVSIDLTWKGVPGSKHAVYLGDQRTLLPNAAGQSRGALGAELCAKAQQHDKTQYQRVTPVPIEADGNGNVVYSLKLPRSLETVQVVRVVPLGPDGAEPPFEHCGTVPIAVPGSRRPPPPLLSGDVDAATGKPVLTVVADAFNLEELDRDEPGLFQAGGAAGDAEPLSPMFRIRRSSGPVADPIYAQVQYFAGASPAGDGALKLETRGIIAPGGKKKRWFEAKVEGQPFLPFVKYVFWAEVRLPPERCLPAGTEPLEGGIKPVDRSSARPMNRMWSASSGPLTLMFAPAPVRLRAEQLQVQVIGQAQGGTKVRLSIQGVPRATGRSIGHYRLAVWHRWGDADLAPAKDAANQPMVDQWPIAPDTIELMVGQPRSPAALLKLHVAIMDPLGRLGPVTLVSP